MNENINAAPTPIEGERETLARTLFEAWDDQPDPWEDLTPFSRSRWESVANAVLARGFRLTPPAPVDREKLEALMEEKFPRREPWEKRNPPMRGDDPAVDQRDDERAAIDEFIDYVVEAGAALAVSPAPARDEWEYGTVHADSPQMGSVEPSLEAAIRRVASWNRGDPERKGLAVRRRKAGPWLPVTEEEN